MSAETPARNGGRARTYIAPSARAHIRRFRAKAGLRADELDAIADAALRGWAEALAGGEHGAARLWLRQLERRLIDVGLDDRVRARGLPPDDQFDRSKYSDDELETLAAAERLLASKGDLFRE